MLIFPSHIRNIIHHELICIRKKCSSRILQKETKLNNSVCRGRWKSCICCYFYSSLMGFPGTQGLTVAQQSKQTMHKLGFHILRVYKSYLSQKMHSLLKLLLLRIPQKYCFQRGKVNRVLHWTERCYDQVQEVVNMEKMADLGINVKWQVPSHLILFIICTAKATTLPSSSLLS